MIADFNLWIEDARTGEEIGRIELKQFGTHHLADLDKVIRKGAGKPVCINGTGRIFVKGSKIKMEGGNEIDRPSD